jgi:phage protein D
MSIADFSNPLVPSFDVLINGTALDDEARGHVASIVVDHSTELPSMFTLEMFDSIGKDQLITWIDDERLFTLGNTVDVKLGYPDDVETLISGEITGIEPEFVYSAQTKLTVRGYDGRHRLQRGRKTQTFLQQKDSEIAEKIARDAGLTPQVEDSATVHDYVLQPNQTDLDFLQERARRIQFEVLVEEKKLIFRPVGNAESEVLTLSPDDHLLEFYPRLVSGGQVSEVSVRSWSPKDKKELVGQAKVGDEISTMGGQSSGGAIAETAFGAAVTVVSELPVLSQPEADQLAKARLNSLALGLITAEGKCWGRTDLRSGIVIKIEGVGERFSGQYYVTSAVHRYLPQQGYHTHFTARRSGA